jgi:hypothetical protein
MSELSAAREANHRSVAAFLATARALEPADWSREPAPGKWSPAQVTEHVTLAYERTRELLRGAGVGGSVPRLLRPLIRYFYVRPILRSGRFPPNAKAPKPFQPSGAPASREALCARLETAAGGLGADLERLASEGRRSFDHPVFGRVGLADALQFQAIHTAHHRQQFAAVPR